MIAEMEIIKSPITLYKRRHGWASTWPELGSVHGQRHFLHATCARCPRHKAFHLSSSALAIGSHCHHYIPPRTSSTSHQAFIHSRASAFYSIDRSIDIHQHSISTYPQLASHGDGDRSGTCILVRSSRSAGSNMAARTGREDAHYCTSCALQEIPRSCGCPCISAPVGTH